MQILTTKFRPIRATATAAILAAALLAALPAEAQTTASSSAFGESVNLQIVPLLGGGIPIQSPAQPFVSGSAPPAYNKTQSAASASLSLPLFGQVLTTHQLSAHAASTVPATDGATADATVQDINLKVLGLLPLLTLSADQISSSATIGGSCASGITTTGSATLSDVVLDGSLIPAIHVAVSPAPNTVLVNLGGIKVIVNEQIVTTSGNTKTLTVNAVHISASGALTALGLLSGDVILAQSKAQLRCPKADLAITKEATDSAVDQGDTFSYDLTVTNGGPDAAQQVTVSDALPSQVSFGSATPSQGSCSESGGTVTCDLGNLASGASATVTIFVKAKDAGTVVNTGSVTSTTPDSNAANNQASATVTVQAAADLSITKTASATTVNVGDPFTYTLTVTNDGPGAVAEARLFDGLPSQVSLISTDTSQGSCTVEAPADVICDFGALAPNATATVTLTVSANAADAFTNTASVKSTTFDPNTSNNSASVSVTAQPAVAADLAATATDVPSGVSIGTEFEVTIGFINNGPNTSGGFNYVSVNFIAGVELVGTTGCSPDCYYFGTAEVGETLGTTITLRATGPGDVEFNVVVSGEAFDPVFENNFLTVTIPVTPVIIAD